MRVFIKRDAITEIENHLKSKEITLLIGPRQAGKTTTMLFIKNKLKKAGKKVIYLNIDRDDHRIYFNSQSDLVNYLKLYFGKKTGYVFIDEIQRIENAGLFLKGIYDRNLPYKFIVSGSGSLELKEKIHESLAGRKRIIEIPTLRFTEFVNFKTNYQFSANLLDFFLFDKSLPPLLLKEYLYFGGYPKVVLSDSLDEKKKIMKEIFESYLEKDIQDLIRLEKTEKFIHLVSLMAAQTGQLVNKSEISQTLNLDRETLSKYLWYLEKTFILTKVTPYYSNIRKELTKMPIYYFNDIGLRNYILNRFNVPPDEKDGFLFQNFIFNLIKASKLCSDGKINFWRTKDGAEVDFIINMGAEIIPVEIKNMPLKSIELTPSMRSFISVYKPKKFYLINQTLDEKIIINNCQIHAIPFFKVL